MYNTELKERFLLETTQNQGIRNNYIAFFNTIEEFEKSKDTDLCELSTDNIQEIVNVIPGNSVFSTGNRVSMMKKYCEWCLKVGIIKKLTWKRESIDFSKKGIVLDTMIKSPEHLQKCLDDVFDKEEKNTADNIYRCYLWLAYIGLNESDAMAITNNNVNLMDRKLRVNDMEFTIYEHAVSSIRKCMELTEFTVIHPNYDTARRERCSGNQLLRTTSKDGSSVYIIRAELSRKFKKYTQKSGSVIRLSYNRVVYYGIFYRMWQRELVDGVLDLKSSTTALIYAKGLKNNPTTIKRSLKKDYTLWRNAITSI